MISGLKFESAKMQDYDFLETFNHAKIPSFPIGRQSKAELQPVLFQGDKPLCVPCSTLWISNWFNLNQECLNPETLGEECGLDAQGTYPSQVLYAAYKKGFIPNYIRIRDPENEVEIERALSVSPLIVGLWDWPLIPHQGHAMVLIDKTEDGSWLCVNWANPNKTDFVTLPSDIKFAFAYCFAHLTKTQFKSPSFFVSLIRKLQSLFVCHYVQENQDKYFHQM